MSEEKNNIYSATEQPDPTHNDKPACWDLVIQDMKDRDDWGREKYKTPLQPFNGRNSLVDFYQEVLDATVYCRQTIEEDKAMLGWLEEAAASIENKATLTSLTYSRINKAIDLLRTRYKIE